MIDKFLMEELSDDVTFNDLKHYRAYKRLKNFVVLIVEKEKVVAYLSLKPSNYELVEGFTRDMTNYGHLGTGDLEVVIKNKEDFEKAKTLLRDAYNNN